MRATLEECQNLKIILRGYCEVLGQIIDFEKLEAIFLKGCDDIYASLIYNFLGVRSPTPNTKYLRLSMFMGKSKKVSLAFILNCALKKLRSWNHSLLTQAR